MKCPAWMLVKVGAVCCKKRHVTKILHVGKQPPGFSLSLSEWVSEWVSWFYILLSLPPLRCSWICNNLTQGCRKGKHNSAKWSASHYMFHYFDPSVIYYFTNKYTYCKLFIVVYSSYFTLRWKKFDQCIPSRYITCSVSFNLHPISSVFFPPWSTVSLDSNLTHWTTSPRPSRDTNVHLSVKRSDYIASS